MRIEQIMTKDVGCCGPEESLNEVARVMWERDCGIVPIAQGAERRLVGVVTDRDVAMAAYTRGQRLSEIRCGDVMSRRVQTCRPEDDLAHAEELMRENQVHRLPVVDASDQLLGIVSLADLARQSADAKASRRSGVTSAAIGRTVASISRQRQQPSPQA